MTREESQFPRNSNQPEGYDPSVQRAYDAGNLPPDPPEPDDLTKLREQLAAVRDAVLRAMRSHSIINGCAKSNSSTAAPLASLLCELQTISAGVVYATQLAEYLEVRRG